MNPPDSRRILRWYPAAWRCRYGAELVAMLDDTYGDDKLPLRIRISLIGSGMTQRFRLWRKISNTYTAYSVGCAVVWVVTLAAVWVRTGDASRHTFTVLFGGWAIGWLSASIARVIYPPPKRRKPARISL